MAGVTAEQLAASVGTTTYLDALRQAMFDALAQWPEAFIYGQDVEDPFGGAFKATKGLSTAYPERVRNAPICEDAMAGLAVGAAIYGARPILEFQFSDFASIAFNQLVNHAATTFYRTGKPCPLVVRLPMGGTAGGGPFHCQSPEAWLTYHPGLIVVAPSSVFDAYHMLKQSIACDDPVMFCENKLLYFHEKEVSEAGKSLNESTPQLPLGKAAVVREGDACTVVAYSGMVKEVMEAAERLSTRNGILVEVIDLRCLKPLDMQTIYDSLARTGRLVMVNEAWSYGGVGAQVISQVTQHAFHLLDAPPRRVSALETPIPYHPELWRSHRPHARRIVQAIIETVQY